MNINKRGILFLIAFVLQTFAFAASVDTVNIFSKSMHLNKKCVVVLPESYKNSKNHFPVVYLLHGYSGNYANWIKKVPELKNYADEFQIIVVCPDGNYNSWYVDSPVDTAIKFDTYISLEVPAFIDSVYPTLPERRFRAITGLSMGGHGALSLALKHADFFGTAGSMSGVQNLVPWKSKYEMQQVFGDTLSNENFSNYSVVNIVKKLSVQIPSIIIDCGVNDPFIETNRQLHTELLQMNIPHDYIERIGAHNWDYWKNSVSFQLLFFHNYFKKNAILIQK